MLAVYCWTWGLPLRVLCILSATSLQKTNLPFSFFFFLLPFSSGYPLEIAYGLGIRLVSVSPLSTGTPLGPDLCRPCARGHSLCELMCTWLLQGSLHRLKHGFPGVLHPYWLLPSLLPSLPQGPLGHEGKELMETPQLGPSVPSSLCTLSSRGPPYSSSRTGGGNFSDNDRARH